MKDIIEFLIKAKQSTYAGKGSETVSTRPNSHDLIYQEDNYMYYDTYLGGEQFSGEEALWIDNIPFWSMNYMGRVIGDNFSGDFLKEALLLVPYDKPYRGLESYQNGDYSYKCNVNGTFDWFQGYEEIFYQDNKIYECYFHDGKIR